MSTYVVNESNVSDFKSQLSSASRVAIDTEFHSERRYRPELFLVQIHVPGKNTWILDPLNEKVFRSVASDVTKPTWIVHSGYFDLMLLDQCLGAVPEVVLDTQLAAGFLITYYPASLKTLLSHFLNIDADKSQTLTNWSKRPLTPSQIAYAAEDVSALDKLWDKMWEQLSQAKQKALLQACSLDRQRAIDGPIPTNQWRKLGARRVLSGRQLNVLQAVAAWRDNEALERGTPPRAVLSDGLVVDVARRLITEPSQLLNNRRLPKSARRHVKTLIELAQTPLSDPPLKSVERGSKAARVVSMLDALAAVLADEQGGAPEFLLPPSLREELSLSATTEIEGILGWRHPLVAEAVSGLLTGALSLGIREESLCTIPTEQSFPKKLMPLQTTLSKL